MSSVMLVVTSTAKDAVGLAARCVGSVGAQLSNANGLHFYSAADEATAEDARKPGTARVKVNPRSALENLIDMWQGLSAADVVVWLDGDDELAPGALERVEHYYANPEVWATYGSFVRDDGQLDYMWNPMFGRRYGRAPRSERWRASHLRTFRAGLVQHVIDCHHLVDDSTGVPFVHAIDVAVMVPLLELAGPAYLAATDVNCVYNWSHSADKRDPRLTRDAERRVLDQLASRPPLEPLGCRPW